MGHEGGEPMLRGVGEPLPRRRTPRLVHHGGGGASRATNVCIGEARGAALTKIMALMMAAATSIGVTARAAVVATPMGAVTTTPAGAAAVAMITAPVGATVAVITAPVGATVAAAAGAAPAESAVATAASTAKVFLLWLPGRQPRLWGTDGVAAGSFTLFQLPNGQPCLCPLDLPGPPPPAPSKAPIDDMVKANWKGRGATWQGG
jgi:hypothetical protein